MLKCCDSNVCFAGDLFREFGLRTLSRRRVQGRSGGATTSTSVSPAPHHALTLRSLKWFEDMITVSVVHWLMLENGWTFADGPGVVPDTVNHARFLHQIYTAADSHSAA